MKNLLFTIAFAFSTATTIGFAEAGGNLDDKVSTVTRNMSTKLGLNESQYINLKALNREKMAKAEEISSMYANDASARAMKISALQVDYENQLQAFLSPKQMESYATYKQNKSNFTAFSADEIK